MEGSECLFCRMASGDVEVERVFDGPGVFAIRDINPRAPVHVLVITKEHVESARQLDESRGELTAQILQAANQVTEALEIAESGFRLTFNVGRDGGQTVPHLHLHVLGGRELGSEG